MLLTPADRIRDVILTKLFFIQMCVNFVLCIGINFGLDYAMNKSDSRIGIIDGWHFWLNISMMVLNMAFWPTVFGSMGLRKRMLKGDVRPLSQTALENAAWKRTVFWFTQSQIVDGDDLQNPVRRTPTSCVRALRYMLQCSIFPGTFVVAGLFFMCWCILGFPVPLPSGPLVVVDLIPWVAYTVAWKTVIMFWVIPVCFGAAHSDAQPELKSAEGLLLASEGAA